MVSGYYSSSALLHLSPSTAQHEAKLLAVVAEKVKAIQDGYDGSHDFAHILRVSRLLETLLEKAVEEQLEEPPFITASGN